MTPDGRDTFTLIRNAAGAFLFAGLSVYFFQKGNKEASLLCLTTAGALFIHSGRQRKSKPPISPSGLSVMTPVLCAFLLAGCNNSPTRLSLVDIGRDNLQVSISPLATSITPISAITDPSSGFVYSGESYNVACTIAGGTATIYPAVNNGTRWQVFQNLPCTMDSSIAAEATCAMSAPIQGLSLTWNVLKTGTGTLSACTAEGRTGPAPVSKAAPTSGPGSGTVTSLTEAAGIILTPNPITTAGTIGADFGTEAGKVAEGGVVNAASCAYPTTFTFNDAGQVTSCTTGSAPTTGTVTSIMCGTGLTCTASNPITASGTVAPTFGTATGTVVQGGVVSGATCASPSSLTFNNAGQVTACTAGSAPVAPIWWLDSVLTAPFSAVATTATVQYVSPGTLTTLGTTMLSFVVAMPAGVGHLTKLTASWSVNSLSMGGTITVDVYDSTTSTQKSNVNVAQASGSNGSLSDSGSYAVAPGDMLFVRAYGSGTVGGGNLMLLSFHVEFGA